MGITNYDKSPKYGDMHKGFTVQCALATIPSMANQLDMRNPAMVKFARLVLGSSDAVRDSIDDIDTYSRMSGGKLSFECDAQLTPTNKIVLNAIEHYVADIDATPTVLAYTCAILAAAGRLEVGLVTDLIKEYNAYLNANGSKINTESILNYACEVLYNVARLTIEKGL